MINLSQFSDKAAGMPSFAVQDVFAKFAGASDGYSRKLENNLSCDNTCDIS